MRDDRAGLSSTNSVIGGRCGATRQIGIGVVAVRRARDRYRRAYPACRADRRHRVWRLQRARPYRVNGGRARTRDREIAAHHDGEIPSCRVVACRDGGHASRRAPRENQAR